MLRRVLISAGLLLGLFVVARIALTRADGPLGPFQGGPLRAGVLVSEPDVDWASVIGPTGLIELQLVEPAHSRTIVALVHDGALFGVCDRGYVWRRLPRAGTRLTRQLLYAFRTWPDEALLDGRAVLRVGGKRYPRQAVRVTDAELLTLLRERVDRSLAVRSSDPLPRGSQDPDSIWFFRMDPRRDLVSLVAPGLPVAWRATDQRRLGPFKAISERDFRYRRRLPEPPARSRAARFDLG